MSIPSEAWDVLQGKVVLVTGASSGLGREFCLDLAEAGCKIVAAARRVDRLRSLCDEINSKFGSPGCPKALAIDLDLNSNGAAVNSSVQKAWDSFGHIDALVNNAGVRGTVKSVLEISEEEWESTFKTNVKGSWLVSKYVCIRMRDAGIRGSVVNISSIAGLNRAQVPGGIAYSSSKAALNSVTTMMALELGRYKIRVNSISPGIFKSEITEGLMQKNWLGTVTKRIVPLRTFGTSNPALTSLLRYLIHDSSSDYVTGNIFIVDAGASLPGVPIFSSL